MPYPRGPPMPICSKSGSFVFKISCSQVWTNGQTKNIVPSASLDWQWQSATVRVILHTLRIFQSGLIQKKMKTKCISKTHMDKRGGAVKLCPAPFSRATSPSLIVCLYLAYSELFVAELESLETRRNNISRSFFQDICKPTSCLYCLIPPPRDTSVITRLRPTTYHSPS